MNIAYLISAHKDPQHLKRLCQSLSKNMSSVHFFIHVDKKVDIEPFCSALQEENVHYVEKRIWTQWGGYGQVEYQRELLRSALEYERHGMRFDRFVILTGQDYPLMCNSDLERFYSNPNTPMMIAHNLSRDCHDQKYLQRITLYHFFRDIRVRNIKVKQAFSFSARTFMRILPFRKKPYLTIDGKRWDVYDASAYAALTHEAASIIYENLSTNYELISYFKSCSTPDELAMTTIFFNTELKDKGVVLPGWTNDLLEVSVLEQFDYGAAIKVYTDADYEYLINSGKPFARKLETGKSDKLMDMLDEHNDQTGLS